MGIFDNWDLFKDLLDDGEEEYEEDDLFDGIHEDFNPRRFAPDTEWMEVPSYDQHMFQCFRNHHKPLDSELLKEEIEILTRKADELKAGGLPVSFDPEWFGHIGLRYYDFKNLLSLLNAADDGTGVFTFSGFGNGYYFDPYDFSISSFGPYELEYHKYWRKHFREGIIMPCSLGDICAYLAEIIVGIGTDNPQDSLNELVKLFNTYYQLPYYMGLKDYFLGAIIYYSSYSGLELPLLEGLSYQNTSNNLINVALFDYGHRTGGARIPSTLLLALSSIDVSNGVLFPEHWNEYNELLTDTVFYLDNWLNRKYRKRFIDYKCRVKSEMLELGPPADILDPFFDYQKLELRAYERSAAQKKLISQLCGSLDNIMRGFYKLKGKRKTVLEDKELATLVNSYALQWLKAHQTPVFKKTEPVKLDLDLDQINKIRDESINVREALKTEEDFRLTGEKVDDLYEENPELIRFWFQMAADKGVSADENKSLIDQTKKVMKENFHLDQPVRTDSGICHFSDPDTAKIIRESESCQKWIQNRSKDHNVKSETTASLADLPNSSEYGEDSGYLLVSFLNELEPEEQRAACLIIADRQEELESLIEESGLFKEALVDELNDKGYDLFGESFCDLDEENAVVLNEDLVSELAPGKEELNTICDLVLSS